MNPILKPLRKFMRFCARVFVDLITAASQFEDVELLTSVCEDPEPADDSCLPYNDDELDMLYRITWAEARGEDTKGLVLVINVIMNRVNSPRFPNSIRDVIFQPRQFTPITNGAFDRATPDQRIKDAVHRALRGEDHSQGALFFRMIRGAEGSWHENALTALFDHGAHRFYI